MKFLFNEIYYNGSNFTIERKTHRYVSVLDYVESKLKPYFNKTQMEIINELGFSFDKIPKNLNKKISNILIGKDEDLKNVDEIFKYSTYIIKNSPYFGENKPKERMSFRNISISELKDSWEDSDWKSYFEQVTIINIRYFFEKFSSKNGTGILKDVKKISFSDEDLKSFKKSYNMLRDAVIKFNNKELGNDVEEYIKLLPTPKSFDGQILEILPKSSKGKNSYKTLFIHDKDKSKVAFALTKEFLSRKTSS